MNLISKKKVLELEGSPRERGNIHGKILKNTILEFIERWQYQLRKNWTIDPKKYINNVVNETNFLSAVRKWSPNLLEEVEGIGEGADIDFDTIFAIQLLDENFWYPGVFRNREYFNIEKIEPITRKPDSVSRFFLVLHYGFY